MDFSEKLVSIRIEKKLLQKDIASAINVSVRQYQRYEKNEQEPTLGVIIALCKYLEISGDWLLGLSDIKERR